MLRRPLPLAVALCLFLAPARAPCDDDGRLGPRHVAVIVNVSDPQSVALGEYYVRRRGIPRANLLAVNFRPGQTVLPAREFNVLHGDLMARMPRDVQVMALAWTAPYRVDCMSITTAFAAGFDPAFCATGCLPTRPSPYFDSGTRRPALELNWYPAMMLAAGSPQQARALVDRGIAADGTRPPGTGYLVATSDRHRTVRDVLFDDVLRKYGGRFRLRFIGADALENRADILFYFTGLPRVRALDTLGFRPGAIADHLTSTGGQLTDSRQMSALAWIEAGATGTYGTVVEPCNFLQKFPHPGIVVERYLAGETLIEAYWKSVDMPGQGVFVGEPLAAPFAESLE